MTRRLLLGSALLLVACGAKPEAVKRYPLTGVVKRVDAAAKTATIQHQKIGDWMEAMTMEFPVQPDSELAKLHEGDQITATVVVGEVKYYVTDVKVTGKAQ